MAIMRYNNYWLIILVSICFYPVSLLSQDVARGLSNIKLQSYQVRAKSHVEDFAKLLSKIAYEEDASIIEIYINQNINGSTRIFTDSSAYIEYDLNPGISKSEESEKGDVITYLRDFHINYSLDNLEEDEEVFSNVIFSNIKTSQVKRDRYNGRYYVRVRYTSRFKGTHTDIDMPYTPIERVAQVDFLEGNNSSQAFISSVIFANPADTTTYLSAASARAINIEFTKQLQEAQYLLSIHDYQGALNAYRNANEMANSDSISSKINDLDRLIDKITSQWQFYQLNSFNQYILENPRDYEVISS